MTFLGLAPAAAWALLAGVAGLVLLLYLIKPSPRRVAIASSLIWRRVLEQRKRRPERWRWWISLLLALALATSIALALTRPELATVAGRADDVLIVVDTSPSMGVRGADGRTRLDLAVEEIGRIVAAAGGGSRFMLADTTHQIRTPAFEAREEVVARARALEPALGELGWFPDLAALPGLREQRQVWFVTDGVARLQVPASARIAPVFRNADNVGITAFEIRAAPGDPRRHDAFVEVSNASAGNKQVRLRIVGAGGTPIERNLRLQGGAQERMVLDLAGLEEGPVRASVSSEGDGFAADDLAFAFLPAKSRVRVALVTPGNVALARALRTLPRVDLQILAPARAAKLSGFDAAVFDRVTPEEVPAVPALLIAPRPAAWLGRGGAAVGETAIADWDPDHPLLARAALRDVLIDEARPLQMPERGSLRLVPIARDDKAAPMVLATREGPRLAVLSFSLEASNFAQQPSFPAFLANAVTWLTRESGALSRPLGQVAVPANARVLNLDGREVATRPVAGGAVFEAREPGLFTAMTSAERLRIAVNVLDPRVTEVNASALAAKAQPPAASSPGVLARTEPWILLLAAAALLLAMEWIAYNRRVTL